MTPADPSEWHLPRGFRYAGVPAGLRSEPNRRDVAVIVSDRPASAAGVFTQNRVAAAPVQVSRKRVPSATVRAVVVCSGNANACTGGQGIRDAERMAELAARDLGCSPTDVLVASTGVIGRPLPMAKLEAGIPAAAAAARPGAEAFADAAHAILTTDTRIKVSTRKVGECSVAGFAKGAAMIGPNLATMLGFVLTDAPLSPARADDVLRRAADDTFNCVSVEGHTSTNDTVFLLAAGDPGPPEPPGLAAAIREVCGDLARHIAADAEGADHLIVVDVEGCASDADARRIAKAVADSPLVKAAVYGADPNWGRVVSAAGYAGVAFAEADLSLWLGDVPLYRDGSPVPFDAAAASGYLRDNREVRLRLRFAIGGGRCTFYTSDLTPEYVRLNADYTT